jgi:RNA methyltransferase, TrmH family
MITSLENERIKEYIKLKNKKERDSSGWFVIEGPHLLAMAIESKSVVLIFSTSPYEILDIETVLISETVSKKISDVDSPQGIYAICRKCVPKKEIHKLLLLDHIQDPGNMGALLRSALAFGFDTVLSEHSADYYQSKVLRSSQGAIFNLQLIEGSIEEFIHQHADFTIIGTAMKDCVPLQSTKKPDHKFAIILGNEGSGVQATYLAQTTYNVTIEMSSIESLNVAIAGSIIMYYYQ